MVSEARFGFPENSSGFYKIQGEITIVLLSVKTLLIVHLRI
jgi:hypothetical protein